MKKIKLLLFIAAIAFYLSCDSAGGGSAKGKGGPDESPENVQVTTGTTGTTGTTDNTSTTSTTNQQPANEAPSTITDITTTTNKDEVVADVITNSDIKDLQNISVDQSDDPDDITANNTTGDGDSTTSGTGSTSSTTTTTSDTSSSTTTGTDSKDKGKTDTKPVVKDEDSTTQTDKIIEQVNNTIEQALKLAGTDNFLSAVNDLENLKKEIKKMTDQAVAKPLLAKIDEAIKQVDALKKNYDSETLKQALAEIDGILDNVSASIKDNNTTDAKKLLDDALAKANALTDAEAKKTAVKKVEKAQSDLAAIEKINAAIKKVDDSIANKQFSDALKAAKNIADETAIANALLKIVAAITNVIENSTTELDASLKTVLNDIKTVAGEKVKDEELLTNITEQVDSNLSSFISLKMIPQEGKWFVTQTKELYTEDEWKSVNTQVKGIRDQIKTLKAQKTKDNEKSVQSQIDQLKQQIKDIKNKYGYARVQKGIHTYWAKQDLIVRITNVPAEGWYNLIVVAKNISGPLHNSYKSFNLTVSNENQGKEVGGINIPASDISYQKEKLLIKLEKGDTDLNLKWTNDSYKQGSYDANIQIRKVVLKYAKNKNKKSNKLTKKAHDYSGVKGRWFWDNNSAYTYWANQGISFSFPDLKAGKYKLTIEAKNYGDLKLPSSYNKFKLNIFADGLDTAAEIPASDKWKSGEVTLDITGGNIEVEISWLNDEYKEGAYDANFQLKKIKLKRIGDSERSAVAAYLLGTSAGSRVMLIGTLFILIMLIGTISLWNRKKAREEI